MSHQELSTLIEQSKQSSPIKNNLKEFAASTKVTVDWSAASLVSRKRAAEAGQLSRQSRSQERECGCRHLLLLGSRSISLQKSRICWRYSTEKFLNNILSLGLGKKLGSSRM